MPTPPPFIRLIGSKAVGADGVPLARSDYHEYVETADVASPPTSQRIGNKTLGDLDRDSLILLHNLVLYSRGLQQRGLRFKNNTGNDRREQAAVEIARLLVSDEVKPGHFRAAAEANRFVHNRLDMYFEDGTTLDRTDPMAGVNARYRERGDSDSDINSRSSRDSDCAFQYRSWEAQPGSNTAGGAPEPGTSATTGVAPRGRASVARGAARGVATAATKRSGNKAQRRGPCYSVAARRDVGRVTFDKQARASAVTSLAAQEEEEAAINVSKSASRKARSRVGVPAEAPLSAGSSAGPRISALQACNVNSDIHAWTSVATPSPATAQGSLQATGAPRAQDTDRPSSLAVQGAQAGPPVASDGLPTAGNVNSDIHAWTGGATPSPTTAQGSLQATGAPRAQDIGRPLSLAVQGAQAGPPVASGGLPTEVRRNPGSIQNDMLHVLQQPGMTTYMLELFNRLKQMENQGSGAKGGLPDPGDNNVDGARQLQRLMSQKEQSVGQTYIEGAPTARSNLPLPAAANYAAATLGTHFDAPYSRTGGSVPRDPHVRDEDNFRLFSQQSLPPPYFRGNPRTLPEDALHHGQAARQQRLGRPCHQVDAPMQVEPTASTFLLPAPPSLPEAAAPGVTTPPTPPAPSSRLLFAADPELDQYYACIEAMGANRNPTIGTLIKFADARERMKASRLRGVGRATLAVANTHEGCSGGTPTRWVNELKSYRERNLPDATPLSEARRSQNTT